MLPSPSLPKKESWSHSVCLDKWVDGTSENKYSRDDMSHVFDSQHSLSLGNENHYFAILLDFLR